MVVKGWDHALHFGISGSGCCLLTNLWNHELRGTEKGYTPLGLTKEKTKWLITPYPDCKLQLTYEVTVITLHLDCKLQLTHGA